ncbi:methionine aminopeptidase 1 [Aaosphaeria arxii CBS 175.79]|uniref:Methionine aminopeptidase n=1 Tax=Aaosphaeria arxii CBS 175.79 TaxID=1450172 RepID=A0A6A5Y9I7_9PLEO|nr:methionine aminopeptidase 1 [Aaosphaeria arxii CBS 175.79]KAF2022255.1 methionine aminopeptidase 1 [Aaosphaeria arxii CBS 175.79]
MATDAPAAARKCLGCDNEASSLQCPNCQKIGKESFFCSQDCFKRNWAEHKKLHKSQSSILQNFFTPKVVSHPDPATGHFNPFPQFSFTGSLRPVYPLSPRREVPASIQHPDYAEKGIPYSEQKIIGRHNVKVLTPKEQDGMRTVCRLAREVLDIAARAAKPGVTTDYIDEIVHKACLERDSYPSPLNYCHFPKSVCTSPNEVICHGIPDQRVLKDGDILNIDVTLYHGGFHGDLNETYYIGDKALADPDSVRVVETARECLDKAIDIVKPGMLFRDAGNIIEAHAKTKKCSVIKTYCGHGINQLFHCAPNVPHYAKNKAIGQAKPGQCFTIEPMISLGTWRDKTWPDDWTSVTQDGTRTAQFEHTLLVTEDGVEILTARLPDSPGGAVPMPVANGEAA